MVLGTSGSANEPYLHWRRGSCRRIVCRMRGTRIAVRTEGLRWIAPVIAGALVLSIHPQSPAFAATDVTAFALDSSVGELVLGGKTLVFTPDDSNVYAQPWGGGVEMGVSAPDHWFTADLKPPEGQTLSPGTYPTTRFASATTAGLDVSGDGVGCNSSTGTVTIHEISLQTEPEPLVERFAATYEFSCEGTSPSLYGELRYHSTFDFRAATSDPVGLNFESQLLGATTSPASVTVANRGTLDLSLGSVTFSGDAAADFGVAGDTCSNVTLIPGASCALGITFTPVEKFTRSAVMHLADDTTRGHRDVPLTGFGFTNPTTIGISGVSNSRRARSSRSMRSRTGGRSGWSHRGSSTGTGTCP
jgi:hypothetical protein